MTVSPVTPPKVRAPALAVLFSVVFINLVGFGLVVPLLPFFAQSLKAEAWQITLMFSAYSLGQFFAEPFWGRLSDRIGRKPVLLATLAANTVGYLMLAFVPNIWLAIAVRLFTGLGAGNISTVQGYVADVTPPEQRAGRMGLIGAAFGLGFIVGPGLGGLLTQPQLGRLGYQLPIFLAAALAAMAAVGVIVFLRESRAKADPAAARPPFLAGLKDARTNPVVSRVLVVTLVYMAGFSAMESVFGLWSESRYAWGAREVGLSFMIVGVISTLNQGFFAGRPNRAARRERSRSPGAIRPSMMRQVWTEGRCPKMPTLSTMARCSCRSMSPCSLWMARRPRASMPSISGMRMSMIIRSGFTLRNISRPSLPLGASSTL